MQSFLSQCPLILNIFLFWIVLFLCFFVFLFVFICRSASKWNYHWTLVATGDFKKVTSGTNDAEKNKPKIKFKIVPPPPKAKAEPPPPPPPKKQASPKLRREKRKVEVDVFRLCWKDSWMSLKPPKYLYLKPKAMKSRISGFTTIELNNNRKYKPIGYRSEAEWECLDKWSHSWKQVLKLRQTHRIKTLKPRPMVIFQIWLLTCLGKVKMKMCFG